MKRNSKGFTMAELLIVVAIIAVLVAIAIPIFTTRLEQSRETTDIANLRSAYAAAQVAALSGDNTGAAIADGNYWYDPDDDIGIGSALVALGQGTATDGHANTTTLPALANTYTTTTNVKGFGIKVTFAGGAVTSIAFAAS